MLGDSRRVGKRARRRCLATLRHAWRGVRAPVTIFASECRAAAVGLLLVGAALAGPSTAQAADAGEPAPREVVVQDDAEELGLVTDAEGFFVRRVTTAERVRLRARWLRPTHDLSTSTDLVVR